MASSSVSFRITRNTQDLAETIHALSQRLVNLEQRLAALEGDLAAVVEEEESVDPDQLESLDQVERLLRDCRDLLDSAPLIPSGERSVSQRSDDERDEDRNAYGAAA